MCGGEDAAEEAGWRKRTPLSFYPGARFMRKGVSAGTRRSFTKPFSLMLGPHCIWKRRPLTARHAATALEGCTPLAGQGWSADSRVIRWIAPTLLPGANHTYSPSRNSRHVLRAGAHCSMNHINNCVGPDMPFNISQVLTNSGGLFDLRHCSKHHKLICGQQGSHQAACFGFEPAEFRQSSDAALQERASAASCASCYNNR